MGDMEKRFWVGGYSPDGGGTSLGIRAMGYTQGVLTDLGLAHAAESPSWLATHPRLPVLYAALEHRGEVAAYRILGHNKLEPLGKPKPAGALPPGSRRGRRSVGRQLLRGWENAGLSHGCRRDPVRPGPGR